MLIVNVMDTVQVFLPKCPLTTVRSRFSADELNLKLISTWRHWNSSDTTYSCIKLQHVFEFELCIFFVIKPYVTFTHILVPVTIVLIVCVQLEPTESLLYCHSVSFLIVDYTVSAGPCLRIY